MHRHDRQARAAADRANLYDEITGKIIAELEAGRFPWVQPWGSSAAKAPLGLPRNASTGRAYSGICQTACKTDPGSASKIDPCIGVAASARRAQLVGVAQPGECG